MIPMLRSYLVSGVFGIGYVNVPAFMWRTAAVSEQWDWKKPAGSAAVISPGAFRFSGRPYMEGISQREGINTTA